MNYCKKCILPDTRPGLVLDREGVCSACISFEHRNQIDWKERKRAFADLVAVAKKKSNGYDCVIPVSGGKDSTWQVVMCLEYGLNPLCITWRAPGRTVLGQQNLDNLISLGVDHIDYSINPEVERKFTYSSMAKMGIPALPMHMALFNIPLNIAVRFGIPLMVWGENPASEYTGEAMHKGVRLDDRWIKTHGVTNGTKAKDWIDEHLSAEDLTPYFGPVRHKRTDVFGVFLGYYFPWDPDSVYGIAKESGFKEADKAKTGLYDYADIDDDFISVHHWFKWFKFGFTRTWDNLSLEIRNGRLGREEAIRLLKDKGDETPSGDIRIFCEFLGISLKHFDEICESFRNHKIWSQDLDKWIIEDFLIENWNWK